VYTGFDDTFCHVNDRICQEGAKIMQADRLVAMILLLESMDFANRRQGDAGV